MPSATASAAANERTLTFLSCFCKVLYPIAFLTLNFNRGSSWACLLPIFPRRGMSVDYELWISYLQMWESDRPVTTAYISTHGGLSFGHVCLYKISVGNWEQSGICKGKRTLQSSEISKRTTLH